LSSDLDEDHNIMADKMDMTWMLEAAAKIVAEYEQSLAKFPTSSRARTFKGYTR